MDLQEFEKMYDGIDSSKRNYIASSIHELAHTNENIYYKRIREEICDLDGKSEGKSINLGTIISELIYHHILYGHSLSKLKTLKCLHDALNCINNKNWTLEREKWERAIVYADLYNEKKNTFDEKIEDYVRQCHVAESAKKLISMGGIVERINGEGVYFKQKSLIGIIKKLDKKIRKFGGLNLISKIFKSLSRVYSNKFERYSFRRNVDTLGKAEIQIPYGFLLNLALKHIDSNSTGLMKEESYCEILEDSKIIISGFCDIQPYLQWEFIYPPTNLISYCKELILWDSIFSIEQCRPSLAIEMAEFLFSDVTEKEFYGNLKFPKCAFFDILKMIFIVRYKNVHVPIYLNVNDFKGWEYSCYSKDILEFLSHKNTVNNEYLIPYDYTKISYFSKPFIRVRNGYLIPNLSWSASTIFEVLATVFRDKDKKFDEKMGIKIEKYLEKKLIEKGIPFISGEILSKTETGESDIIIESSRRILFLELKKKVLTAKAKSGDSFSLFSDLSLGFLNPIVQAYRNEFILYTDGKLQIKQPSDTSPTVITHNNRCIDRIAVSKMEYNSFTDEVISGNIIYSYYRNSFSVNKEGGKWRIKKMDEISKKQAKLRKYIDGISAKVNERDIYFGSHFKSLAQIIEVICDSNSTEDFCENLLKTKHMSTSSLDWYFDYEYMKRIEEK